MENVRVLSGFQPSIVKDIVFRQLNCYPDSPVYEEMDTTYDEMLEEMVKLCKPKGVIGLGRIPGNCDPEKEGLEREAVYILATVGQEMSDYSTRAFGEGDYVKGMLADAMADAALFSLEDDIQTALRDACGEWGRGVKRRLEAPQDIPMEIQKEAMIQTGADALMGLEISQGYMFRPLKTSCQVYLTTEDQTVFKSQHNCRTCPNLTCSLRHVEPLNIRVKPQQQGEYLEFSLFTGTLLEALHAQIPGFQAPCGGRGSCGKCRIRVMKGYLAVTLEDKKTFSETELEEGWRLACQAVPLEDLTICLGWGSESGMEVVAGFQIDGEKVGMERSDVKKRDDEIPEIASREMENHGGFQKKNAGEQTKDSGYGFAVDIGTTTLAVQLYDLQAGKCIGTYTGLNSQRDYGADVIARIQASIDGKGPLIQDRIRRDLNKGMEQLLKEKKLLWEQIGKITIAGNTTMIHLLMGYPCDGLGSVPFTPYEIGALEIPGQEVFPGTDCRAEIVIYPGISTFVGADIVSGICALHMGRSQEIQVLIDLGTNGEMALGNREKLLVTSTAAGPAFEGGNITWGTGSVPGAVCNVHLEAEELKIKTIQDAPAVGICGTGVIELTAELVKAEEIDETGRLEDPWFDQGYPVAATMQGEQIALFQKDIRELQLAKAAVRAGLETLLEKYGVQAGQVDRVYVAGGFGYQLDYEKAMAIGMFPQEFRGKIQAVGNSSLYGAAELLIHPERMTEAQETAKLAKEVSLSADPVFQEAYMDAMFFEEE